MAARESATCPNCGTETAIRNNMNRDNWLCTNCMTRFVWARPVPVVTPVDPSVAQAASEQRVEEAIEATAPPHLVLAGDPEERHSREPSAEPVEA